MPRPRKDGKPSTPPVRIGAPRLTPHGGAWRVRAYAPTPGAPHGRVAYRRPETGRTTSAVPQEGETLDELFEVIEKALNQQVAIGTTTQATASTGQDLEVAPIRRTITALGELYLQRLTRLGRDEDYIANRRCLLTKYVYPVIGEVLARDWSTQHTEEVQSFARGKIGAARIEDLGSTLAGLRKAAHAKRPGGRWLSPDENPLEDVSFSRGATIQGAHRSYVLPRLRPSTESVEKAIAAAQEVAVWSWMPDIISIAAFCAPRLGEQLALRAIDVDLTRRQLDINGVWKVQHKASSPRGPRRRYRSPHTKNGMRRITPYLGSQDAALLRLCRTALCLAADTPQREVIAVIDAERARRASFTETGEWSDFEADPAEEAWLFPDASGVPPTKETFNSAWHKVRDACAWSPSIPYKNLRHHAATWWRGHGFDWVTIADWDGHDWKTLQSYYVLPAEDATLRARPRLDAL